MANLAYLLEIAKPAALFFEYEYANWKTKFPLGQTFSLDAGMWFNRHVGLSMDGTLTFEKKDFFKGTHI